MMPICAQFAGCLIEQPRQLVALLAQLGVGTSGSYTGNQKIRVNINGTDYYLIASTTA